MCGSSGSYRTPTIVQPVEKETPDPMVQPEAVRQQEELNKKKKKGKASLTINASSGAGLAIPQ